MNKVIEFIHFQLFHCTLEWMRDTMALVSVSRDKFYKRYRWKKYAHGVDEKRGNITVKYVIDPPKWADNDRLKRTMKTATQDCVHFAAHSEAIQ